MIFVSWLIHCLLMLLSVAFYTLFERKLMAFFTLRTGPNKVSIIGLVQPLLDGVKLFLKQNLVPSRVNKFIYHLSPMFGLLLAMVVWMTLPTYYVLLSMNYSLVLFFCLGSILVFSVLMSGWSSNSKYSLIGSLRSVAQSISYESVFSTLVVLVLILMLSYSIRSSFTQSSLLYFFILPIWFICTLAETHRVPFDFSESESELVSGFNTEYSGASFSFIFLTEYLMLLYSCFLITYLFFMWLIPFNLLVIVFMALFFSFSFVWIRVTYCRYRYDMLMMMSWKVLLPLTLCLFVCYLTMIVL